MNVAKNIVKILPKALVSKGGRTALILKKYSPEILTGIGVVSGVASTILACRATLKIESVLNEHDNILENIEDAEKIGDISFAVDGEEKTLAYTEQDGKEDRIKLKINTGLEIARLYAPAVAAGALSIGCVLGGKHILTKRNAAIAAAYSVAEGTLKEYRQRVVAELGAEKDREFLHGLKSEEIISTTYDDDGKKHKERKTVAVMDPTDISQYAKAFDDASPYWKNDPEMNLMFLKAQQNYANDLLRCKGHVLLNDVYDMLGIPRTKAGCVVGWILEKGNDNFVDFGIYSIRNQEKCDFLNGYESSILLDFNVDGVIFDLI